MLHGRGLPELSYRFMEPLFWPGTCPVCRCEAASGQLFTRVSFDAHSNMRRKFLIPWELSESSGWDTRSTTRQNMLPNVAKLHFKSLLPNSLQTSHESGIRFSQVYLYCSPVSCRQTDKPNWLIYIMSHFMKTLRQHCEVSQPVWVVLINSCLTESCWCPNPKPQSAPDRVFLCPDESPLVL